MDDSTVLERKKEGFIGQQMVVLPPNSLDIIKKNILTKNFYLTAIGFYPHAKFHDRKRIGGANEYILLYCTEGQGIVSINNNKYDLKPNHYIILPPTVAHHYKSSLENPWTIYWVHFIGNSAKLIFERFRLNNIPVVRFIPYNENRVKNFLKIIQLLKFSFEEKILELVNINIIHIISSFVYQQELQTKTTEKNMVNNSLEYMKANLNKSLKIEELASKENLSISRYSELFKKSTGQSPIHYFINLKIQKACQHLYFTDMSVKQIAIEFGFSDQYYFSRIFKKIMGVPPTKYRKNYKK